MAPATPYGSLATVTGPANPVRSSLSGTLPAIAYESSKIVGATMPLIAQVSGQAISGAIDSAIAVSSVHLHGRLIEIRRFAARCG